MEKDAENWANARKKLGLNKSEMAQKALRVAPGTYNKWESGRQRAPAVARAAREMLLFMADNYPNAYLDWISQGEK